MTKWIIKYTPDKVVFSEAVVVAPSYLMALVEFMRQYPNCEFCEVIRKEENE